MKNKSGIDYKAGFYVAQNKIVNGVRIYCVGLKKDKRIELGIDSLLIGRNSSEYIGVCFIKNRKNYNWAAFINNKKIKKNTIWIGFFLSENGAARAYNDYVMRNFNMKLPMNKIIKDDFHNSKTVDAPERKLGEIKSGFGSSITKNSIKRPNNKEGCIQRIIESVNENNKHLIKSDNQHIIDFLNGNKESIKYPFEKYISLYKTILNNNIKYYKRTRVRGKRTDFELNYDDFIQEGYIRIIKAINLFMYTGGSFKKWSSVIILNYARMYLKKQREEVNSLKEKAFDYDAVWNGM